MTLCLLICTGQRSQLIKFHQTFTLFPKRRLRTLLCQTATRVPSENGPHRTLGHRGSRNPPVQGWDGDSEVTGHIARWYSAREKLFG
jgi:hypothetical protein